MRAALALAFVSAGCIAASAADALNLAQHSIDWYESHVPEQLQELNACMARHAFLTNSDCGNANEALLKHLNDETMVAEQQGRWTHSLDIVNANPAAYRASLVAVSTELHACHGPHTGATPPPNWCAAAEEAWREDGR